MTFYILVMFLNTNPQPILDNTQQWQVLVPYTDKELCEKEKNHLNQVFQYTLEDKPHTFLCLELNK